VEVDRDVGVGSEQPVEQEPGVPAGGLRRVLVAGPHPVHVDELDAPARAGPAAGHAFERGTRDVEGRRDRARHRGRIELLHDALDCAHRTHLVAVDAARQKDALARPGSPGDGDRDIPVLAGDHLDTLEIELVPAGLEVIDVERAQDAFALDHVAGEGGPARRLRLHPLLGLRRS